MTGDVLENAMREVVIANRILANERVVDAYGHVSVRHPLDPTRYLLSRSRAPELVERGDVIEFDLEGKAVRGDGRAPGAHSPPPPALPGALHSRRDLGGAPGRPGGGARSRRGGAAVHHLDDAA